MLVDTYDYRTGENLNEQQKAHVPFMHALQEETMHNEATLAIRGMRREGTYGDYMVGYVSELEAVAVYDRARDATHENELFMAAGHLSVDVKGVPTIQFKASTRSWVDLGAGPQQQRQLMHAGMTEYPRRWSNDSYVLIRRFRGNFEVFADYEQPDGSLIRICAAVLPAKAAKRTRLLGTYVSDFDFECEGPVLYAGTVSKGGYLLTFDGPVQFQMPTFTRDGFVVMQDPTDNFLHAAGDDSELLDRAMRYRDISRKTQSGGAPLMHLMAEVVAKQDEDGGWSIPDPVGFMPEKPEILFKRVHSENTPMLSQWDGVVTDVIEVDGADRMIDVVIEDGDEVVSVRFPAEANIDLPIGREVSRGDQIGNWRGKAGEVLRPTRRDTVQWMANDFAISAAQSSPFEGAELLIPADRVHPCAAARGADGEVQYVLIVSSDCYDYEEDAVILPAFAYEQSRNSMFEGRLQVVPPRHAKKGVKALLSSRVDKQPEYA